MIEFTPDGSFSCSAESYYQDKYTGIYEKEDVTMQEISNLPFEEINRES